MSVEAITWALRQPIKPSSVKFVLVCLANCASGDTMLAYPSSKYLSDATGQDRKTVLAGLAKLRDWGLIEDTGKRVGTTKQIPVFRVLCQPDLFAPPEPEGSRKRDGSENGMVPKSPGKGPVFPAEPSRKRDPEPSLTVKETKAKAAPSAPLPDPPEWLKPEAWTGFVEMRKRIRHPLTPYAARLVLSQLDRLRADGTDPVELLDQSTRNGWRDVFPLRVALDRNGRPEPPPQHQPDAREVMARHKASNPASPATASAALAEIQRNLRR